MASIPINKKSQQRWAFLSHKAPIHFGELLA